MVLIRGYKDTDYDDVRLNLQEGDLYNPERDSRHGLGEKIRRNPDSILVAEDRERAVGNVYIVEDGWAAFIFRLAVRRSYRESGIGSLLMENAEARMRKKGIKEVSISVRDHEVALKEFYAKRGYIALPMTHRWMYKALE
ncbi:MAG: GNAT family N-acetyltransferase [Candidatus Aenigmarchaeota archaeon]|nr:GNAT family N-acetyltransferase [Candidatus Aenigmarchaeota archaeon]